MYYYIGKINFNPSKNSELSFADNPGNMESLRLDNGSGGIAVCSDARIDSRQKMISCSNELNGIKVVFEGTLYNLEEIKRQYIKDDAHIKHPTNASLVAELYKNSYLNNIAELDGDFSFFIRDEKSVQSFLYRSRSGLKPLFYYVDNDLVLFSSYLKMLMKQPRIKREINPFRLYSFFMTDGMSLGDDTEFKNVYDLRPGELLVASKGSIKKKILKSKSIADSLFGKTDDQVINDYYQVIEKLFGSIFKVHKNIGIAFSGGLDTQAILAFAVKFGISAKTYTIKFLDTVNKNKKKDWEEASQQSKKYGAKHREIDFYPQKFIAELDDVLNSTERLVSLPELNSFMIMKLISRYSDIVFSGDGSEEQLGMMNMQKYGYDADKLIQNLPDHNAVSLTESIMTNYYNMLFWRGWGWHCEHRSEAALRQVLFTGDYAKVMAGVDLYNVYTECYHDTPDTSFFLQKKSAVPSIFNKILRMDYRNFILHNKIAITDVASRLYSFQVNYPYLQNSFVEYSGNIPGDMKFKDVGVNGTKLIFRKSLSRILGEEYTFPGWKSGSDFPLYEWMLSPVAREYVYGILDGNMVKKSGIINHEYVERILKEHYALKKYDHTHKIGKLIIFQKWSENNI